MSCLKIKSARNCAEFIVTENSERLNAFIRYPSVWTFWRTPETPTLPRCLYRKSCALTIATLTRVSCYLARHARGVTVSFTEMRLHNVRGFHNFLRCWQWHESRYFWSIVDYRWLYRAINHDAPYVIQGITESFVHVSSWSALVWNT